MDESIPSHMTDGWIPVGGGKLSISNQSRFLIIYLHLSSFYFFYSVFK